MQRMLILAALMLTSSGINAKREDIGPVTCGSVIKLQHKDTVKFLFTSLTTTSALTKFHLREIIYIRMLLLGVLAADSNLSHQMG